MPLPHLVYLFKRSFQKFGSDRATRLAAALAFYAILSLAPLLVFALAVASQFLDAGAVHDSILRAAGSQLGEGAKDLIAGLLDKAARPQAGAWAGLISISLALFAASGLFSQVELTVDAIWRVGRKAGGPVRAYLVAKFLAVVMVVVFVALILVWLGVDSALSFAKSHLSIDLGIWRWVSFFVSVAFLTGVFGLVFKGLPRGKVAWRDVWLAAFVTALGFGIAKYLLSLYFGMAPIGQAYGSAGAFVVVLIWVYYTSQIFLFGEELTYVYAYRYGSLRDEVEGDLERS